MDTEKSPSSQSRSYLWFLTILGVFGFCSWLMDKPVTRKSEETDSNRNAPHTTQEGSPVLTPQSQVRENVPKQQKPSKGGNKVPAWLKFGVNVLTLASVFWYAYEARKQRVSMDNTLSEVRMQTGLLSRQLEGTVAAVLTVEGGFQVLPFFAMDESKAIVGFANYGRADATDIHAAMSIEKVSIPSQAPIKVMQWAVDIPDLISPTPPETRTAKQAEYALHFSPNERVQLRNNKMTVKLKGSATYYNGFRKRTVSFCYMFLWVEQVPKSNVSPNTAPPLVDNYSNIPCADFAARLQYDLSRKRELAAQK